MIETNGNPDLVKAVENLDAGNYGEAVRFAREAIAKAPRTRGRSQRFLTKGGRIIKRTAEKIIEMAVKKQVEQGRREGED